jgi:exodeoxyribonuclease VII large subunit
MTQLPLFQPSSWTVGDLTRYLRDLLEGDEALQDLWVIGEASNVSRPGSGHLYFTLKDNTATLRCVMWRNAVLRQSYLPREGEALEAHGSISLYEAGGQYQLYADLIRPAGEGALYQQFVRLKARLEAEGLFDPARKRPIPRWPGTIGIVTSPTGAAIRDMLNTLQRRYPIVHVVLAPTQVQGETAPPGIVAALQALNQLVHPDVILLARGGGSIEDLWAFNDERVARAIVASQAPVISGVGHETDFTIADFAADLRAPTPTAAAELATPDQADLRAALSDQSGRMRRSVAAYLEDKRWEMDRLKNQLSRYSPIQRVRSGRQRLDDLSRRLDLTAFHQLELRRAHLGAQQQRLVALNPLGILERGYAMVTGPDGQVISSVGQVHTGDPLRVQVKDGNFNVEVVKKT